MNSDTSLSNDGISRTPSQTVSYYLGQLILAHRQSVTGETTLAILPHNTFETTGAVLGQQNTSSEQPTAQYGRR